MIKDNFDIKLKSKRPKVKYVSESFRIGQVAYYDELPTCTETPPNQTVVTLDTPGIKEWVNSYIEKHNSTEKDVKKHKKIDWKIKKESIENLDYGQYKHCAVVEYDNQGNLCKFSHDIIVWSDGAVNPLTSISTPGIVIVPIEKLNNDYYVHCFWQWRYVPWNKSVNIPKKISRKKIVDFIALNRGEWFLTTPGGFASNIKESPINVAKREAFEESGIVITEPKYTQRSFNRAHVSTMINLGYIIFQRKNKNQPIDDSEKILGKIAVRIDKFRTQDAMVGEALQFAREEIGLISSTPII